jgi:hypothetical protein
LTKRDKKHPKKFNASPKYGRKCPNFFKMVRYNLILHFLSNDNKFTEKLITNNKKKSFQRYSDEDEN